MQCAENFLDVFCSTSRPMELNQVQENSGRQTDRARETETDRQTDRQIEAERQTDRQIRQTDRQTDTWLF